MNARPPGRPRILSRERIVEEARRIADGEGLEALTVRRVAQALGTGQASLYRHIADRDQLLGLLADDVAARLPLTGPGGEPRSRALRHWLGAYDHLAGHVWAARIMADGRHPVERAAEFTAGAHQALAALAAPNTPPDATVRLHRVLWHLLLAHVIAPRPPADTPSPRDDFAWSLNHLLDTLA